MKPSRHVQVRCHRGYMGSGWMGPFAGPLDTSAEMIVRYVEVPLAVLSTF